MMKVHVLGHWGAYPEAGQATTGLLIETEGQRVLVDVGSGVLSRLFEICGVADLTSLILTHHHHDHTADLGVFGYALLLSRLTGTRKDPLPMYMLPGPSERMNDLQREPLADLHVIAADSKLDLAPSAVARGQSDAAHIDAAQNGTTQNDVVKNGTATNDVAKNGATTNDVLKVSFAPTVHPVPCLAVRVEHQGQSFVFSADTSYCQPVIELARNADVFLCESSMYEGQEADAKAAGHVTAVQAGEMAAQAGVKHLVLTHLPHYGDLEKLNQQAATVYHGPITRAAKGTVLEVGR